jgi:hypothetical protein
LSPSTTGSTSLNKKEIDAETHRLAVKIRDVLGTHMAKFEDKERHECVISCLVALGTQVGRIKRLAVSTGIVDEEEFDNYFDGVSDGEYKRNQMQYNS